MKITVVAEPGERLPEIEDPGGPQCDRDPDRDDPERDPVRQECDDREREDDQRRRHGVHSHRVAGPTSAHRATYRDGSPDDTV
jgi:hypothetical protein